jgi:hypothetical protein
MRKANIGGMIAIDLVCLFVGAKPSAARALQNASVSSSGHAARTWHCQSRQGDLARHSARLSGAFETEYDVENWEKALRQERAQRGERHGICDKHIRTR